MLNSIGQSEESLKSLDEPKKTLTVGRLQRSTIIIMSLVRSKPSKPDQKQKKTHALKQEVQEIRRQGHKEDKVLPKCIHDAALKSIASGQ